MTDDNDRINREIQSLIDQADTLARQLVEIVEKMKETARGPEDE